MREGLLFLGIVVVVGILASAIFLPDVLGEGGFYSRIDSFSFDLGGSDRNDNPSMNDDPGITGNFVNGDSSGDSDGSGGNQDQQSCYDLQISYSIKDFTSVSECLSSYQDVCLEKSVDCSLIAQNLDPVTGGEFGIRMYVIEEGDLVNDALDSSYLEKFVSAGGNESFDFSFSFFSQSSSGDANEELECFYVTERIPQREICS